LHGIEETSDGSLWLCESRGIVHIFSAEVRKSLDNPAYRVDYDLFNSLDGLPGTLRGLGQIAREVQGTDGRLWFMATDGVAWINPARISKNALPLYAAIFLKFAGMPDSVALFRRMSQCRCWLSFISC
jgi:hypothetical protein